MLRPERMSQVTLLCRNGDARRVIELLADLKAVHLIDHKKETVGSAVIDIGKPAAEAQYLADALVSTRNLLSRFFGGTQETTEQRQERLRVIKRTAHAIPSDLTVLQRIERIQEIAAAYAIHESDDAQLERKLLAQHEIEELLEHLAPLDSPIEAISGTKSVRTILASGDRLHAAIALLDPVIVLRNPAKDSALITVRAADERRARDALESAGCAIIDLSPLSGLHGTPKEAMRLMRVERLILEHQQKDLRRAHVSFMTHVEFLLESEPILALEILKAQAPLRFGVTRRVTLIRGYVPNGRAEDLERALRERDIPFLIDCAPAPATASTPVRLRNPRAARSFEALLDLYALPRYDEIDPTILMAFTFPLFFGFMLGDIGYGVVALAVALILHRAMKDRPVVRAFAAIFALSALAALAFGVVFGEFFGSHQILGMTLHPYLSHTDDLGTLFTIAVGIGLLHLNLGLLLGMANESAEHGWFFAIAKKGSWMLLEVGVLLLVASQGLLQGVPLFAPLGAWLGSMTGDPYLGIGLSLLAVFGIWYGERIKGLLELPMLLSNTLSYTRLAALGLASVYLATVVNHMAIGLFGKGGLWLALGVLVLLLGHAINLFIGILGPFLHALRLHYVEFFTKFYEGGGERYAPFGETEAMTG